MTPQPQPDYFLPSTIKDTVFHCKRYNLKMYPYELGLAHCLAWQKQARTKVKWPYHFATLTNEACDRLGCEDCPQGRELSGYKPRKHLKLITLEAGLSLINVMNPYSKTTSKRTAARLYFSLSNPPERTQAQRITHQIMHAAL